MARVHRQRLNDSSMLIETRGILGALLNPIRQVESRVSLTSDTVIEIACILDHAVNDVRTGQTVDDGHAPEMTIQVRYTE